MYYFLAQYINNSPIHDTIVPCPEDPHVYNQSPKRKPTSSTLFQAPTSTSEPPNSSTLAGLSNPSAKLLPHPKVAPP